MMVFFRYGNSARFLWKSIPQPVKENQPEVIAAWTIGQRLWTWDYAGVHEAVAGYDWKRSSCRLLRPLHQVQLLLSACSTISIQDTARYLGMAEDDASNYVVQQGWSLILLLRW